MDAFLFANRGGLCAFPGRGDLDEHALAVDAELLVEADEVAGLLDGGFGVEGKAGVDFGGNATGDDVEDLRCRTRRGDRR